MAERRQLQVARRLKSDFPCRERQQPGKRPQKRRFAGAVRARDEQGLTGCQREGEIGKNLAAAAVDTKSVRLDMHDVICAREREG